jgi:FKBP-type peptidyl-prolyl cis-trans isomerase
MSSEPIKVTEDGGVKKLKIIKTSTKKEENETPHDDATCEIHYEGRFADGKVFDSSKKRFNDKPYSVVIGKDTISGITEAIKSMRAGEIAEFQISPKYGYGNEGFLPYIPPNSELFYTIELISFEESDEGILKRIDREGTGEETPIFPGAKVRISYTVMLEESRRVVDQKKDIDIILGDEEVIVGIEKCVASMKKGEVCFSKIFPKNSFSEEVCKERNIPPKTPVIAFIELTDFTQPQNPAALTPKQKNEFAEKAKEEGNKYFMDGKYKVALKRYEKALATYPKYTYNFSEENQSNGRNENYLL